MLSVRFLAALAIALVLISSSSIAQNQPGSKPDPAVELLAKLRKPIDLERQDGVSLADFAARLGEKTDLTILIGETAFKSIDPASNPSALVVKSPQLRAMSLTTILPQILGQVDATYLVSKDHIDIVPIAFAAKETNNIAKTEEEGPTRLAQPLVSIIFKEKPLNDAVAELAEEYNLTVIVSPQSGDARTGFITARLLNTPADKALELLAIQCDLRVVRKANAFLITSRDHANDLFNERMEHERAKIDLEKFRKAPYTPPQPQPAQLQAPQPQIIPAPAPPATTPAPLKQQ
jgi:hypothetical protein